MADGMNERVVVSIDDEHLADIDSVATALQSAGLRVSNVLRAGGIITGEVTPQQRSGLRAVAGVLDVESDGEMRAI